MPSGQIRPGYWAVSKQVMLAVPNGTVEPFMPGVDSSQNCTRQQKLERAAKRPALIRMAFNSPAISRVQGSNAQASAHPGFYCPQTVCSTTHISRPRQFGNQQKRYCSQQMPASYSGWQGSLLKRHKHLDH
jgi:hypothetical protein